MSGMQRTKKCPHLLILTCVLASFSCRCCSAKAVAALRLGNCSLRVFFRYSYPKRTCLQCTPKVSFHFSTSSMLVVLNKVARSGGFGRGKSSRYPMVRSMNISNFGTNNDRKSFDRVNNSSISRTARKRTCLKTDLISIFQRSKNNVSAKASRSRHIRQLKSIMQGFDYQRFKQLLSTIDLIPPN